MSAVTGVGVAVSASVGQWRLGPVRWIPVLLVGVVISGVIGVCGMSLADGVAALLLAVLLLFACGPTSRYNVWVAGGSVILVTGMALAMWMSGWNVAQDTPLDRLQAAAVDRAMAEPSAPDRMRMIKRRAGRSARR